MKERPNGKTDRLPRRLRATRNDVFGSGGMMRWGLRRYAAGLPRRLRATRNDIFGKVAGVAMNAIGLPRRLRAPRNDIFGEMG